jgi:hypothetical protein
MTSMTSSYCELDHPQHAVQQPRKAYTPTFLGIIVAARVITLVGDQLSNGSTLIMAATFTSASLNKAPIHTTWSGMFPGRPYTFET